MRLIMKKREEISRIVLIFALPVPPFQPVLNILRQDNTLYCT